MSETMERLTPEVVTISDGAGSFRRAPVVRVIAHPPGTHPESPIVDTLTALELVTAHGSRWHGFERVWIGSDLRMHVAPINLRDEVVRGWPEPETSDYAGKAFEAYLECALWSSTDADGRPLDDYFGPDDIVPDARASMRAELDDFLGLLERENVDYSEVEAGQMGHDFWLTRNRHGAGFWDRGLGDLGDTLTKWAHSYGPSDLYVADDGGWVYVS